MTIRAGFVQFAPAYCDVSANRAAIARFAADAHNADLLVLPELATSGYDFKDAAACRELAEPFGTGPTGDLLRDLAAQLDTTLVCGYPETDGNHLYNSCMLARPDGACFNYRKIHLYSRETEIFQPGDAEPPVIETPAGRIGLMICFDWFFPETARVLALKGAQIIAHPSNLVMPYCQRAMYARSIENRVFTITANRTGTESGAGRTLTFTGASQVLDMEGNTLAQAPVEGACVTTVEIDPARADSKRLNEHNDLWADRRTTLYGAITG